MAALASVFSRSVNAFTSRRAALANLAGSVNIFVIIWANTPEAVFSSESSNRATADIQLDSPTTGRVVFLQYNQDWVAKYVNDLFAKELALQHINGKVWIEFEMQNQSDEELQQEESDDESLHKPIRKKGQEDQDRTDSTRIARDGQNHRKNHDVPNITREQPRYNR